MELLQGLELDTDDHFIEWRIFEFWKGSLHGT